MVDERTTPDPELEAEPADTPPVEPVVAAPVPERTDQPAPGPIAQAEYTRATQLAANVRKELGLAKSATPAEVLEALRQARAGPVADEGEAEPELDPRIAAADQRAFQAELRMQQAVYGDEFTRDALELFNAARNSDDLEELFTLAAGFRDTHPATSTATGVEIPVEPAPEPGTPDIGMSEGERATPPSQSTPSGRKDSGVVSHLRGLLNGATAGAPPPRT